MKTFVLGCLGVSILSICVCSCLLILTLRAEMTGTRAALVEKVDQVRIDSFAEIDAQANGIRKDTLKALKQQSVLIRKDLADGLKALNQTVSEPLDHITVTLQDAVNKADKRLASLDDHIAPVLANAATLTKDAQDSLDDVYPDVRAMVESATVATTQAAQTMETVNQAMPQWTADIGRMADSGTVIAGAAASEAKKFTAPQTRRQKLMMWLEMVPRVVRVVL